MNKNIWLSRKEAAPFLYLITGKCYPYQGHHCLVEWEATEELKKQKVAG